MRIAMIGSRGVPARAGGIERVVDDLSTELVRRGHEVLVYARPHYVSRKDAQRSEAQVLFTNGIAGKHLDAITHTATAAADVLRRKVDVVHFHAAGPALMSWLPALARRPVVLTVHSADWRRDKWSPPAQAMIRLGLAVGMRVARQVTSVCEPLASDLSRRYNRDVNYVPNAPPAAPPRPREHLRWELRPDEYVLFVGRIVPEKRLGLLLEAWRLAAPAFPLVVAGDVDATAYGRRCRREAAEDVRFVGPQYERDLATLYRHAALVVQPSVLEGMSLVLLEAAAHGRCILASDIPENTAVLGEAALYFATDDVTQLAAQIGRCLQNEPLRSQLGRKAERLVHERYSWPLVAERMERIYRQACHRPRG